MGRGEIVAPVVSEKTDFSASGENTWLNGHPGAIRTPKAGYAGQFEREAQYTESPLRKSGSAA